MQYRGFSLIEALIAMTVVVVGVVALAQLVVVSGARNAGARTTTLTLVLAEQKMEQLRAEDFGPSPPGTLLANTTGWVDYVDATGGLLGATSTMPPIGAAYARRWSVELTSTGGTLVLQVVVTRQLNGSSTSTGVRRTPGDTWLVGAKPQSAIW